MYICVYVCVSYDISNMSSGCVLSFVCGCVYVSACVPVHECVKRVLLSVCVRVGPPVFENHFSIWANFNRFSNKLYNDAYRLHTILVLLI